MRFDIYGRFQIEALWQNASWCVYRVSNGLRVPADDIVIPLGLPESELETYLDDIFHELAGPGDVVRRLR